MKLRPISLYSVVTAFFNHQYFMLQSWATMITIANKLVSSILFSGYINNNIWHLHIAFFATGPGLGLIMYLLTTLEFPTQYCFILFEQPWTTVVAASSMLNNIVWTIVNNIVLLTTLFSHDNRVVTPLLVEQCCNNWCYVVLPQYRGH